MALAFAAVGFVTGNAAVSLLTFLLWRSGWPRPRRAGALFLMRMAPAIGSVGLVLGIVLPAFWAFEPRGTTEAAGSTLIVFMLLAAALVGLGLHRAARSWLETRRLERAWKAAATARGAAGLPLRGYRVSSSLPFAALVGVFRPRLFVSGPFLDSLSPGERRAVMDHEAGHLRSFDNLKRTVMKLSPDWLSLTPVSRDIEAAWAIAAEEAADDHAAGFGRACSLDLASALLKAARAMPLRCAPVSNFCDGATIARRVARLLQDRSEGPGLARRAGPGFVWVLVLAGAGALLAVPALEAAYAVTEAAVRLLQ